MSNYETQKEPLEQSSYQDESPKQSTSEGTSAYLEDNRPSSQRALQMKKMMDSYVPENVIQPKQNNTGLPDNLKSGIENLSGYSMDDVNVHYNSDKPAQLNAHAYAQGTDIHLASGQEKHLPHEAWHVVQQKQGRVQPTMQMKEVMNINDDDHLEKEADEMGDLSLQHASTSTNTSFKSGVIQNAMSPIQRMKASDIPVGKDNKPIIPGEKYLIPTGDMVSGIKYVEATFLGRSGSGIMALALFKIEGEQGIKTRVLGSTIKELGSEDVKKDVDEPNADGKSYFQGTGVDTERAKAVYDTIRPILEGKESADKGLVIEAALKIPNLNDQMVKSAILYLRKEGLLFPSYPGPKLNGVKNFSLDPNYTEEVGGKKKVDKSLAQAIEKIIATEGISGTNKHDKVRNALIAVINSSPIDVKWNGYRQTLIGLFKNKDAAQYYTDTYVRAGDEHEQLITSMTADQVLYDLENPMSIAQTNDGPMTSLDYQKLTNIATQYVVLKTVTPHSQDANKVSQNHHPTSKELISFVDSLNAEKLHGSPGSGVGGSPHYHQELAKAIGGQQGLLELNQELIKINIKNLAGRFDILGIPADKRVDQTYVQTNGTVLHFNIEKELHKIARNVEVRRRKVLGLFYVVQQLLEDQAPVLAQEDVIDREADSDDEMDKLPQTPGHY